MRRTRIAAATVMVAVGLIGAVAAPATAAKTHRLVGEFDGQPGSTVSMKVKLNDKGKPKFVKSFKFSGLDLTCGIPPFSGGESGPLEVPGKIRVKAGTKPREYRKQTFDDGASIAVSGTLHSKGKLSAGRVDLTLGAGSGACFGGGNFEASKE